MEIKFKAWDKKEQRYRDDVVLTQSGNPQIMRTSPEFKKAVTKMYKNLGSFIPEGDYYELDFTDFYAIENIEIQPV